MKRCTEQTLLDTIAKLPGAVLVAGAHPYDAACCILEARSLCMGLTKTDSPQRVGLPDIRPLNDAPWSSAEARTRHMLRLAVAFDGWAEWPETRQRAVMTRTVIETVKQIISTLPGLPDHVRQQCRSAETLDQSEAAAWAADAARAAAAAAAWAWAADAARAAAAAAAAAWAADAARAAAAAAAWAADADTLLIRAVDLWIAAARGTV